MVVMTCFAEIESIPSVLVAANVLTTKGVICAAFLCTCGVSCGAGLRQGGYMRQCTRGHMTMTPPHVAWTDTRTASARCYDRWAAWLWTSCTGLIIAVYGGVMWLVAHGPECTRSAQPMVTNFSMDASTDACFSGGNDLVRAEVCNTTAFQWVDVNRACTAATHAPPACVYFDPVFVATLVAGSILIVLVLAICMWKLELRNGGAIVPTAVTELQQIIDKNTDPAQTHQFTCTPFDPFGKWEAELETRLPNMEVSIYTIWNDESLHSDPDSVATWDHKPVNGVLPDMTATVLSGNKYKESLTPLVEMSDPGRVHRANTIVKMVACVAVMSGLVALEAWLSTQQHDINMCTARPRTHSAHVDADSENCTTFENLPLSTTTVCATSASTTLHLPNVCGNHTFMAQGCTDTGVDIIFLVFTSTGLVLSIGALVWLCGEFVKPYRPPDTTTAMVTLQSVIECGNPVGHCVYMIDEWKHLYRADTMRRLLKERCPQHNIEHTQWPNAPRKFTMRWGPALTRTEMNRYSITDAAVSDKALAPVTPPASDQGHLDGCESQA